MMADLSKIKNKSLAGADLTFTSFLLSDLSGIDLSGVTLKTTNFWEANLSGLDFTVTSKTPYHGSLFIKSNLSNSNFEGVDLAPREMFTHTFENDASAKNLEGEAFLENLFGPGYPNIYVISKEVHGNDLVVNYVLYNNFSSANLENANFKNASLMYVNFFDANLTNADLSGADLRKSLLDNANLQGADLTGADLTGANLSGAIFDDNTIRNCVGHSICD